MTGLTFGIAKTYALGVAPTSIAVGDLNRDGRPDLATINDNAGELTVLVNLGGGRFAKRSVLDAGPIPESLHIADVNGDHRPDLILLESYQGAVDVRLNRGGLKVAAQHQYPTRSLPESLT